MEEIGLWLQGVSNAIAAGQHDSKDKVQELGHESKFERLREIIEDKRFRNEKLLVFTEHRDALTYLKSRLDSLGFTLP